MGICLHTTTPPFTNTPSAIKHVGNRCSNSHPITNPLLPNLPRRDEVNPEEGHSAVPHLKAGPKDFKIVVFPFLPRGYTGQKAKWAHPAPTGT